jgi:hypothetical protein
MQYLKAFLDLNNLGSYSFLELLRATCREREKEPNDVSK